MRQGQVYVHGILAGLLTEVNSNSYRFEYNQDYLDSEATSGVCIAMPKRKLCYESNCLFPFFANLLSEGENREYQSRLLRLDRRDDFGILLNTAEYDTIGCVTVKPVSKQ